MKATINITTPAGKSLEGFPLLMNPVQCEFGVSEVYIFPPEEPNTYRKWNLHKGDTITIKIEE